jgi:hypothetical protein
MTVQQDIARVLCDEHSRSMDFTIAGLRIHGGGLEAVARRISGGGIAVCVRDRMSTPGRYRMTRDELHVSREGARTITTSNSVKALMVHEAVHALTDMRNLRRMTSVQSESAGFMAQTFYRLRTRRGRALSERNDPIFLRAQEVIFAEGLLENSGRTVSEGAYAALREAIQEHPNYRDDDHDASAGANGIRTHHGARCSI